MREPDDEVTTLLKRARKRISDPSRWTWGAFAEDRAGGPALPRSRAAKRWCAVGALEAEARGDDLLQGFGVMQSAYHRLQQAIGPDPQMPSLRRQAVERFNDRMGRDAGGHARVLEAFDEAIRAK